MTKTKSDKISFLENSVNLLHSIHEVIKEVSGFVDSPNYPSKENLEYVLEKIEQSGLFIVEEDTYELFGKTRTKKRLVRDVGGQGSISKEEFTQMYKDLCRDAYSQKNAGDMWEADLYRTWYEKIFGSYS